MNVATLIPSQHRKWRRCVGRPTIRSPFSPRWLTSGLRIVSIHGIIKKRAPTLSSSLLLLCASCPFIHWTRIVIWFPHVDEFFFSVSVCACVFRSVFVYIWDIFFFSDWVCMLGLLKQSMMVVFNDPFWCKNILSGILKDKCKCFGRRWCHN